jgi:hypothetical protein
MSTQTKNGKYDFFEFAIEEKDKEDSEVSLGRSIVGAPVKGFLRESGKQIRKTLSYLPEKLGVTEALEGRVSEQEAEEKIQKLLPTKEDFVSKSLERGGEIAPYSLIEAFAGTQGKLSPLLRTLGAGFAGQAAEELGAGPLGQSVAEIGVFAGPSLGKALMGKGAQKSLIQEAKALGLTDEQLAPLIQGETKQKFLSKLAERRGRAQTALKGSKAALDNVYGTLQKSPHAASPLAEGASKKLISSIQNTLTELPSATQELIAKDFQQLLLKPITGDSLINFYSDINSTFSKGGKSLGILKGPIKDALSEISPSLGNNFNLTNKLYNNYFKIASRLKPNLLSDLMTGGELTRLGLGIITGNVPLLIETAGESAGRSLATEMLINPRLQNLSGKIVSALNQGKTAIAQRIMRQYVKEVKDVSPEIAKELQKLDFSKISESSK